MNYLSIFLPFHKIHKKILISSNRKRGNEVKRINKSRGELSMKIIRVSNMYLGSDRLETSFENENETPN